MELANNAGVNTFAKDVFFQNTSTNNGSALGVLGSTSTTIINGCNFTQNSATTGGAVVSNSTGSVSFIGGCVFNGNHTGNSTTGGAITLSTGTINIDNAVFQNNYNNNNPANTTVAGCDITVAGGTPTWSSLTNSSMQQAVSVYTATTKTGDNANGNSAGYAAPTTPSSCSVPFPLAPFAPPADNYYVDNALGLDVNAGSAWGAGNALKTIDKALALVQALPTGTSANIYVMQGTYAMANTAYTLTNKGLLLQGGFKTGSTGTDISQYSTANTTTMQYSGAPSPAAITMANTGTGPYAVGIKGFVQNGLTGNIFFSAIVASSANTAYTFTDMVHMGGAQTSTYNLQNLLASNTVAFTNCSFTGAATGNIINLQTLACSPSFTTCTFNKITGTSNVFNLGGNTASPMVSIATDCIFTNNKATSIFNFSATNTGSFVFSNMAATISGNKVANSFIYTNNSNTGNFTLSNCTFDHDTSSGSSLIYNANTAGSGTISISSITATNNIVGNYIITTCTTSQGSITNSVFCSNTAPAGSVGIYISNSSAGTFSIDGCAFDNNKSTNSGNSALVGSAANSAVLSITNCTFYRDSSTTNTRGSAVWLNGSGNTTLSNDVFMENYAPGGGGFNLPGSAVYSDMSSGNLVISSCNFTNNGSGNEGGAISRWSGTSPISITNCVFDANHCTTNSGGAVWNNMPTVIDFDNCTFRKNYINGTTTSTTLTGSDITGTVGTLTNSSMQQTPLTVYSATSTTGSNSNGNNLTFVGQTAPSGCSTTPPVLNASLLLSIKVFLQGAYTSGSTMRNDLRTGVNAASVNMIPLTQPYASGHGANKVYAGTEHVSSFPSTAVDWVLVQLRSTATGATVATRAGILLQNGTIIDTAGNFATPLSFPNVASGSYYIVVRHRNHLGVMSATAQALTTSSASYDFTTGNAQAYSGAGTDGNNTPMALLSGGLYGMWGGDANDDGQVYYISSGNDVDAILNNYLFGDAINGYNNLYEDGDVNMDGQTYYISTGSDKDWILNIPLLGDAVNGYLTEQVP